MARVFTMTPSVPTYYVDATGGDDSNEGKSETEAWQTIAKVNAATLNPGDQVLFKRGQTFAGTITPGQSGTLNHPITYGAYGSGDRPVINGAASRAFFVNINARSHIRCESLDFSGSASTVQGVVNYQSHDAYFYDCIFRDGGTSTNGFYAYTQTGAEIYNITLDSCIFHDNDASGVTIGSVEGTGGPHDCIIKNCTVYSNGTTAWLDHGIYVRHGAIIENCTCYNNTVGAGIKVNCQGVTNSPYLPTVRNNICYSNFIGIVVDNVDSLIYNNLIYANTTAALNLSFDSDRSKIYYNTLVNSTSGAYSLIRVESLPDGVIFRNNLLIQDAAVANLCIFRCINPVTIATLAGGNDFNYNLYYHDGTGSGGIGLDSGGERTWATWQAAGMEANGTILSALPGFVARYTNLHPADGGNLKGLGVALASYGTDLDGNTRADPPTQGCYEEASA